MTFGLEVGWSPDSNRLHSGFRWWRYQPLIDVPTHAGEKPGRSTVPLPSANDRSCLGYHGEHHWVEMAERIDFSHFEVSQHYQQPDFARPTFTGELEVACSQLPLYSTKSEAWSPPSTTWLAACSSCLYVNCHACWTQAIQWRSCLSCLPSFLQSALTTSSAANSPSRRADDYALRLMRV